MTRRGWEAGPADDETEDLAELRHTQALAQALVVPHGFDTAPLADVLQAEPGQHVTPVRLVGPARIRQLSTRLGAMFSRAVVQPGDPVKLVDADPRRALLYLVPQQNIQVQIGATQARAADIDSVFWPSGGALAVGGANNPLHWTEELWVKIGFGTAPGTYRVGIVTELWTR